MLLLIHFIAEEDNSGDNISAFLLHAKKVIQEAKFIVQSLPNAEVFSVEHALRLLYSVYHILLDIDDPGFTQDHQEALEEDIIETALPLHEFLQQPPPPRNINASYIYTKKLARPRYRLNLQRAGAPPPTRTEDLDSTELDVIHFKDPRPPQPLEEATVDDQDFELAAGRENARVEVRRSEQQESNRGQG